MIVAHYRFPRGSRIVLPLDAEASDGEDIAAFTVTSWLRYSGDRPGEVTDEMPVSAEFAVEIRPAKAGWFLIVEAFDSIDLATGWHIGDVRISGGGVDAISDRQFLLEITQPVTGGA